MYAPENSQVKTCKKIDNKYSALFLKLLPRSYP